MEALFVLIGNVQINFGDIWHLCYLSLI